MGSAQPNEPLEEPDDAAAGGGRADWLCGPEEGLEAEMRMRAEQSRMMERPELPKPTLLRPGGQPQPPAATPPAPPAPPRGVGAVRPEASAPEFESGFNLSWQPGTRSVPSVRRDAPAPSYVREPTHDFPMDDAEERARVRERRFAEAAEAAEAAGEPHAVIAPEDFDVAIAHVPWWMQVPHVLMADRRIQAMVALALAVLATIALWPRGEQPVSVSNLKRHPERFDGATVKVAGRVGEVFPVGQGYAFELLDGRDTLVVFTRSRTPVIRQHVELRGTMSRGYLDGQERVALFEDATPR